MFTKLTDKETGRELWKEYHLCLICMKWMCLNDQPYVWLRKDGLDYYAHKSCVPHDMEKPR